LASFAHRLGCHRATSLGCTTTTSTPPTQLGDAPVGVKITRAWHVSLANAHRTVYTSDLADVCASCRSSPDATRDANSRTLSIFPFLVPPTLFFLFFSAFFFFSFLFSLVTEGAELTRET
jgi:hypothetical protein